MTNQQTENCLRTAGGVAADFVVDLCGNPTPPDIPPLTPTCTPPITALEPILRGKVCDLFITPKLPGRFVPTVNFRPDTILFCKIKKNKIMKRGNINLSQTFD